mgnify:CR=1 FL=1
MVPRENKNNDYAKFGGTNKEYYGIFQSGLWITSSQRQDISCLELRELVRTNLVIVPAQGQIDKTDMFYLQTANLAYQF